MIEQQLINTLMQDAEEVWPQNFSDIEKMFNKCCFAIAFDIIKRLELFKEKNDCETVSSIIEKVKVFQSAEYVIKHILTILSEEEVLIKDGEKYICKDNDPYIENPSELLVLAAKMFPEEGAAFQWLARSYNGLNDFITGKVYAEEVLFPFGSFKLVEEVYNTSNVYGFYSKLAGRAVKRITESIFQFPVTLLEVGAGTGNGTENVLNTAENQFGKYIFTDVSKALLQMGRRRFKRSNYDFLEYKEFDAGREISKQGFKKEFVDIILGVNVFHATNDITRSLTNASKLLKKGGILVLSEIGPPADSIYRYMELTFGLLPSYAIYNDIDVRPLAPIIRSEQWVQILEKLGFSDIHAIPGTSSDKMDRGGVVFGVK